jgi:CDP-glycerol glycerophosphotransferase (TagB/SpsB family)
VNADDFRHAWRAFVLDWCGELDRGDREAANALLERALTSGLESARVDPAAAALSEESARSCEIALLTHSGAVDVEGYRGAHPGLVRAGADPVQHFCTSGWKNLNNPSLDFDVWWYTTEHLGPEWAEVNPLLHYLLVGRRLGLVTLPPRPSLPPPAPLAAPVRRACLFAGYDEDGVVDDYVVAYVTELSRFADVFYLADCAMAPGELDKLASVTKGAWAQRHGTYDFGSYSRLATDLVGWDVLSEYDEVVFANDASYLLRPLDRVFATMDAQPCDYWGLQLTARHFDGADEHGAPLPLPEVLRDLMPRSVWHYDDFPHVGSYFFAVRRRVLADQGFRKHLGGVSAQATKLMIVYKYETGTTYRLVGSGFHLSTFVPDLHPYHPVYSPGTFTLIADGFPLLKRAFIAENPYDTPDLADWKKRVGALVPDAPVDMFERNLLRVAADDKLRRSFSITTRADGSVDAPAVLTNKQMRREDERTPTFDHWWAFPVCAYDHTFAGNERAVFEMVKDDPSIKKIVLTRSRRVTAEGENVVVAPISSPEGQYHVLRARTIFVKHAPRINVPYPLDPQRHNFINLWHGIPLKRFGWPTPVATPEAFEKRIRHHLASRAIITSSKVDSLAMAAAFHPLRIHEMWPTGLPRNDFVVRPDNLLPRDLLGQVDQLRSEVGGRRLVMFLPTFKDAQADAYYRFTDSEIDWLRRWMDQHDAVLGVREHMADRAHTYAQMLAPLEPINLSSRRYPDLEPLYRVAEALISDYSSCLVDFQLTGKPLISFAYDYDHYVNVERGLFYDLEKVLPGPVCRDFDALAGALDHIFDEPTAEQIEDYGRRRSMFFDHLDDRNAARVVRRVKELYLGPS